MVRDPKLGRSSSPVRLNLEAQAIEFEDRHGTVGRLRFIGETVLDEGRPLLLLSSGEPVPPGASPTFPIPAHPRLPIPPRRCFATQLCATQAWSSETPSKRFRKGQ